MALAIIGIALSWVSNLWDWLGGAGWAGVAEILGIPALVVGFVAISSGEPRGAIGRRMAVWAVSLVLLNIAFRLAEFLVFHALLAGGGGWSF